MTFGRAISINTYKINVAGYIFMFAAVAVFAGALGGSDFQRGVAGLLVYNAGEIATLTFEGSKTWLKRVVLTTMPVGIGIYVWGLYLTLSGLS